MKAGFSSLLISVCLLSPGLRAQEDAHVQPKLTLSGLWAASLAADFSFSQSDDIKAFYAPGSISMPESQVFPGVHASVRRHFYDLFYLGLGFSTLPKGYTLQVAPGGDTESYSWDALYPHALGGISWYRGSNSYLYFQGELGTAFLYQAIYVKTGAGAAKGSFEGSTFASAVSLGGVWLLMPSVGLELQGGYRRALIQPVEFRTNAGPVAPVYTREFAVNDSGPYARAALSFFWGVKNPWGDFSSPPDAPIEGPPAQ